MRAVVVDRPGGPDRLELREVPEPSPRSDEVVVRICYAGCNWSDIQKREGTYPDPVHYPIILGAEVSGRVVAKGRAVRKPAVGDRVGGITGPQMKGGYAELVSLPATYAIAVPETISLATAAAFPVVTLTAYHLLRSAHRLRKGETVLVHAIGGAVGLMVTQMATALGASVIGTVGSRAKGERALEYGARRVINREEEDFVSAALAFTGGRGVDLVIDSLGGDVLPRSFDALRPYGRVINIGEAAGEPEFAVRKKLYERSTSLAGFEVLHAAPGSARWERGARSVVEAIASGALKVPVERVFALEQAAVMHRALEGRRVGGKLLLGVAPEGRFRPLVPEGGGGPTRGPGSAPPSACGPGR